MDQILASQIHHDELHQLRCFTFAGALLNVPHLAHHIAGRTPGNRRYVRNTHEIGTMTGDTWRRIAADEFATDDSRAAGSHEVLAFFKTSFGDVSDES